MELSVASGAVDGDKSGEDAHQEEDQHHVLREPNVLGGGGSGDGEGKIGGNHWLCHEVNRVQLSIARGHFGIERKKWNLHLFLPLSLFSVLIWQIF